jgi:DNA-binding CsgD family transcriptional regulator
LEPSLSKSNALRLREIREIFRLAGDCRTLGTNRLAWNQLLIERAAAQFDAVMTNAALIQAKLVPGFKSEIPDHLGDYWEQPEFRTKWLDIISRNDYKVFSSVKIFHRRFSNQLTLSREQLIRDAQWANSVELNEFRKPCGQDDFVYSMCRVSTSPFAHLVTINKAFGGKKFTARQRKQLQLLHAELTLLFEADLTLERAPTKPLDRLPARLRQVLEFLFEGATEKQIAFRMGLSRHTVHDYVKSLHRRLGVHSRAELIRLCGKLGWDQAGK